MTTVIKNPRNPRRRRVPEAPLVMVHPVISLALEREIANFVGGDASRAVLIDGVFRQTLNAVRLGIWNEFANPATRRPEKRPGRKPVTVEKKGARRRDRGR